MGYHSSYLRIERHWIHLTLVLAPLAVLYFILQHSKSKMEEGENTGETAQWTRRYRVQVGEREKKAAVNECGDDGAGVVCVCERECIDSFVTKSSGFRRHRWLTGYVAGLQQKRS